MSTKRFTVCGYGEILDSEKRFIFRGDAEEFYEEICHNDEYQSGSFTSTETGEVLAHFEKEEDDGYAKLILWVKK